MRFSCGRRWVWSNIQTRHSSKIERGFDFLGYHFSKAGLTVAKQTIVNLIEKASRLYEQERSAVSAATALEMYVRRRARWADGGLNVPRAVPAQIYESGQDQEGQQMCVEITKTQNAAGEIASGNF